MIFSVVKMQSLYKTLHAAAAKSGPLDRVQEWSGVGEAVQTLQGSLLHAASFIGFEQGQPLIGSNSSNCSHHGIRQPATSTTAKAKCRSVSLSFLSQIGRPSFAFDVKGAVAAAKGMSSVNMWSTLSNTGRQFSTYTEEMEDTLKKDEVGPALLPEQVHVVNQAVAGRNIFFTGPAGCGKSTVLREVRRRLEDMGKIVHVMAPTGIVALAIKGTTTWSFAGWSPDSTRTPLKDLGLQASKNTLKRLRQDVIIIDEISMIERNYFERFDFLLRQVRKDDDSDREDLETFGGIQVIITGDFCQLPPVKPFQHCVNCGRELRQQDADSPVGQPLTTRVCEACDLTFYEQDKYAFSSPAWQSCNFVNIHLKAIHRQKNPAFISLLQKCRLGIPFYQADVRALTDDKPSICSDEAVKIFPLRADVRRTNQAAFGKLNSPAITFECRDHFQGRKQHRFQYSKRLADGTLECLEEHRWERQLSLKRGMRVLLLANLCLGRGLCNGSQGTIIGFEPFVLEELSNWMNCKLKGDCIELRQRLIRDYALAHETELSRDGFGWPIVRFDNGQTETVYPNCEISLAGFERPYSLVSRTQVPLAAGYALSIHKSQGMTLEKVIVDVSKAFQEKQIYVAISRAKTLQGLKVVGLTRGGAICDDGESGEKGRDFLRKTFGEEAVEYRLDTSQAPDKDESVRVDAKEGA